MNRKSKQVRGFVLVGGESRRMGRNKALLPYQGRTLAEHIAAAVTAATGSATLVGPAAVYAHLGLPVMEDTHRGSGPLSGIVAALEASEAEWSLVVACDAPQVDATFGLLAAAALESEADVVMARGPEGRDEPLLAAYRETCLDPLREALAGGRLKVRDALEGLKIDRVAVAAEALLNANTPEEWARIGEKGEG